MELSRDNNQMNYAKAYISQKLQPQKQFFSFQSEKPFPEVANELPQQSKRMSKSSTASQDTLTCNKVVEFSKYQVRCGKMYSATSITWM